MTADTTLAPSPTEREQFEAWVEGPNNRIRRDPWGMYCQSHVQHLWEGWIAARFAQAPAPKGIEVVAYGLGDIRIEKVLQMAGPAKWAVRRMGDVLNRTGGWEWEPSPSGRDDAFLDRCRFESAECAILAARGIAEAPSGKPT